jgi:hypothetical protein
MTTAAPDQTPLSEPAPLTAAECADLRTAVLEGAAGPKEVHERLIAALRGGRHWRTTEWNETRSRLIGRACEQCGSAEPPFTLQHLWHPERISDVEAHLRSEHRRAAWEAYQGEHALDELGDVEVPTGPPRPCCPKCGGFNLSTRVKTPFYRCATQRNKRKCDHAFDEPALGVPTRIQTAANRQWDAFTAAYGRFYSEAGQEKFYRTAVAIALDEFAAYMAGEGTATFCKRCAYMWDKKGLRLCPECGDGWCELAVEHCRACEGSVRYVMCAECGVRRHSDRYPTCFECGTNFVLGSG